MSVASTQIKDNFVRLFLVLFSIYEEKWGGKLLVSRVNSLFGVVFCVYLFFLFCFVRYLNKKVSIIYGIYSTFKVIGCDRIYGPKAMALRLFGLMLVAHLLYVAWMGGASTNFIKWHGFIIDAHGISSDISVLKIMH